LNAPDDGTKLFRSMAAANMQVMTVVWKAALPKMMNQPGHWMIYAELNRYYTEVFTTVLAPTIFNVILLYQ
jgi:hypothetical protein